MVSLGAGFVRTAAEIHLSHIIYSVWYRVRRYEVGDVGFVEMTDLQQPPVEVPSLEYAVE
jgi:hypothetical protein